MAERAQLSRLLISSPQFRSDVVERPSEKLLSLPERAVQFGTGAFLRAFVEYFIDAASRRGAFAGRVVAIASTASGRDEIVNEQDGLYTLVVEGIDNGEPTREFRIMSSLSRAVDAASEWDDVLEIARNADIELVFSNTTEVGIVLDDDEKPAHPPRSFPGKLTMFLFEKARAKGYDSGQVTTVIPCELVENNGARLREIVILLAQRWSLGDDFIKWLNKTVAFCDTLVDRIVTGRPVRERSAEFEEALGYSDKLLTVCEPYRLFAIQPPAGLRSRLEFAGGDDGVIVTDDVEPFRLRKVRLLNGAHSLLAPVALQCGLTSVAEAVADDDTGEFLRRAMFDELVPACRAPKASEFAAQVLERFANPYIAHKLRDIMLHATAKIRVRVIPSVIDYIRQEDRPPDLTSFGFAAFLFLRSVFTLTPPTAADGFPADDGAVVIKGIWDRAGSADDRVGKFVANVCGDESLWGMDLRSLSGFTESVTTHFSSIHTHGVRSALNNLITRAGSGSAVRVRS